MIAAAHFPMRSDPENSQFLRPRAYGRIWFSAQLLSMGSRRLIEGSAPVKALGYKPDRAITCQLRGAGYNSRPRGAHPELDQLSLLLDLFDPTTARHKFLAITRAAVIGNLRGTRRRRTCIGHFKSVEVLALLHGACLCIVQRVEIVLLIFDIGFTGIHLGIELLQAIQAFRCLWVDIPVLSAGSQQYCQ